MNDHERIHNLLREGRITEEEAQILLGALRELEEASPPPHDFRPQTQQVRLGTLPPTLRWVRARLRDCSVAVKANPRLQEPDIRGPVSVQDDGADLEVGTDDEITDDVRIELPEGWGLELDVHGCDFEAEGLAWVKGRAHSCSVELERVQGVDLELNSCDFEATLKLSQGEHRLVMASTDAEIELRGSSVKVEGRIRGGDLDPRGPFTLRGRDFKGQLGRGEARLWIEHNQGDLTLEA
ncbi:hypothetical protein Mterra_02822 [Calidithermus terrae]|uniref:Adhesin domain-containing protein n=1 Tax=Calidithermus terrae TaxID=1408545 RepID=A0A399EBM2_9DEIN|nr:hypothetical protein [Calidithermus terrae]RIH82054.1 hypothetical protein Mterra_02822 [Calidithermus terrae]